MKLNIGHIAKTLTGKTKYKKSSNKYSYPLFKRVEDVSNDLYDIRRDLRTICKKLKLEKVGDVIMDEKDAKKYNDQY